MAVEKLPLELVEEIVSNLGRDELKQMRQVCRKWNSVVTRILFHDFDAFDTGQCYEELISRIEFLTKFPSSLLINRMKRLRIRSSAMMPRKDPSRGPESLLKDNVQGTTGHRWESPLDEDKVKHYFKELPKYAANFETALMNLFNSGFFREHQMNRVDVITRDFFYNYGIMWYRGDESQVDRDGTWGCSLTKGGPTSYWATDRVNLLYVELERDAEALFIGILSKILSHDSLQNVQHLKMTITPDSLKRLLFEKERKINPTSGDEKLARLIMIPSKRRDVKIELRPFLQRIIKLDMCPRYDIYDNLYDTPHAHDAGYAIFRQFSALMVACENAVDIEVDNDRLARGATNGPLTDFKSELPDVAGRLRSLLLRNMRAVACWRHPDVFRYEPEVNIEAMTCYLPNLSTLVINSAYIVNVRSPQNQIPGAVQILTWKGIFDRFRNEMLNLTAFRFEGLHYLQSMVLLGHSGTRARHPDETNGKSRFNFQKTLVARPIVTWRQDDINALNELRKTVEKRREKVGLQADPWLSDFCLRPGVMSVVPNCGLQLDVPGQETE